MEKKNVFILIFLCFLISNTVCKEEPNNISTESLSKVYARFKTLSARHADEPLRSRQHKFPVHTTPNTDSFTSDDERISLLLDGKNLLASKDDLKPTKLAKNGKYDKTKIIPTIQRRRLSRLRKLLKVFASSHGARRTAASSVFGDIKGKDAFAFKNTPPSFGTGEQPYKIEINVPFKLTILPTEETVTPSVGTTDRESEWILTQNDSAENDEEKSSHNNDHHKDDASAKSGPKVTGHEGKTQHGGTSVILQHKMAVYPGMKTSSGLRWNMAHEHAKLDEGKKRKRFKKKKKKSDSRTEDPVGSDSSAVSVAGILAGILMILFIVTGVPRLWNIFKKRWRRHYERELRLNIPSTGYLSEELSEEEVLFDRTAMGRNNNSSKSISLESTPNASPRSPTSAPASYQPTGQETQKQKTWTLTDIPKSTSLIVVPILTDTSRTEVWTVNEIPESKSLDSSSKESSSLFLLPSASDELTCTVSMATDSTSSFTESCKTPVSPRHEVVITMDDNDDEEIIYTSEKSQCEELCTVKDDDRETCRENVVIRMEPDDGKDRSLLMSESEASEELINTSEKLETNNLNTDVTVIDVRSRDDENDELLAVNDNCKDDADKPSLTLPSKPSPTVSAERRRGKSVIGGRKALENRRFIKHLISEQESTGFKHDLNTAISRILGENRSLEDKNKGKRNVIKHQTQETKYSLAESISRAKLMIMNENVDKEREKRSFLCRQTIQQTLSNPVRPAIRTLAQEIAFAKEIILPSRAHPRAAVRTKAKREVRSTSVLDRVTSASNTQAKTKYMNHKDYQNWKLLQKDAEMKKAKGVRPDVSLPSMKQIASFFNIFIPDVDYDVTVCQCFYCDKHRKRDRVKGFSKLSRFHS